MVVRKAFAKLFTKSGMIKLIASDLDGTLLPRGEKRISAEVEKAVKAAINKGIKFAVITGRSYPSVKVPFQVDNSEIYYYCCGGAVGIKGGKTLYSKPVTHDNVILALKSARDKGVAVMLSGDDEVYIYGDTAGKHDALCREHGGATKITCMTEVKRPIYKISFLGVKDGENVFASAPNGLKLWYRRHGLEEYINRFASKGAALSDLMMRTGVLAGEVVAAGDVVSDDADMLKKAGTGLAFSRELVDATGATYAANPIMIFQN